MEVSMGFVVVMGMGVTFVGLTCIIVLTLLMGKVMTAIEKRHPEPEKPASRAPAAPIVPAAPTDGLTEEVKLAIMMALMQEPGFRMENVTSIDIRRV